MNKVNRLVIGKCFVFTALAIQFTGVSSASGIERPEIAGMQYALPHEAGEAVTQLPDGRWLTINLAGHNGSTGAAIKDSAGRMQSALESAGLARSGASATLLPDGQVLIYGGTDATGTALSKPMLFDPRTSIAKALLAPGLAPRVGHTATLLTTGEVLITGGKPDSGAQLWNPRTLQISPISETMLIPRSAHTASLLSTSPVLITGGVDASGQKTNVPELYLPLQQTFAPYDLAASGEVPTFSSSSSLPQVAEAIPADRSTGAALTVWPAIRFSKRLDVRSLSTTSVTLFGPAGSESIMVTPAEAGMLLFTVPTRELQPDSDYTLFIRGATDLTGGALPFTAIGFHTAVASQKAAAVVPALKARHLNAIDDAADLMWHPKQPNFTQSWTMGGALPARARQSKLLVAERGTTALSGQVLLQNGTTLANVNVSIGKTAVLTDSEGRFLLKGIGAAHQVMVVDGRSANTEKTTFGQFVIGVDINPHVTNALPYTVWMPVIDTAHAVSIDSPASSDIKVTTPSIPGLELVIPKGSVLRDLDGKIVTSVSITPVPVDRAPFPVKNTPSYFTIQPGGAYLETVKGTRKREGMKLYYPNDRVLPENTQVEFNNYDPYGRGWFIYGNGTVRQKQNRVEPNKDVAIYELMGAMYVTPAPTGPGPLPPPPQGPKVGGCDGSGGASGGDGGDGTGSTDPSKSNCDNKDQSPPSSGGCGGDPVDCFTGAFLYSRRDLVVPDTIPVDIVRKYNSSDANSRPFGMGFSHSYSYYLYGASPGITPTSMTLVHPSGATVSYGLSGVSTVNATLCRDPYYNSRVNSSACQFSGMTFSATATPSIERGSAISFDGENLNLKFKTGNMYQFSPVGSFAMTGIVAPDGRKISVRPDYSGGGGAARTGAVISPNGRSATFSYGSSNASLVTSVSDNAGHTVNYAYDSSGRLSKVNYPDNTTESYTYDGTSQRIATVIDGDGNTKIGNTYDTSGRVSQQTQADGTTTTYVYGTDSSGNAQTTITDPLGNQKTLSFDSSGYVLKSVSAVGAAVQQTVSYTHDPNNGELITSTTDALNRTTTYSYDGLANVLSVTRLAGTSAAITTSATYEPNCNKIKTSTDELGHTTTYSYDASCHLRSVVDPLGHAKSFTYNSAGQISSIADALGNTTNLNYNGANLASATDPLGRTSTFVSDSVGRLLSVTNANGEKTSYTYTAAGLIQSATDSLGNVSNYAYDNAHNLTSFSDPKGGTTQYTYFPTNLPKTRTDALGKATSYVFDGNYNLTQLTDPNGNVDKFSYDALNRLTEAKYGTTSVSTITLNAAIDFTYTIDAGDRVTQVQKVVMGLPSNTTTTISRAYDNLDRVTLETQPNGSVSYTYLANSLRQSLTAGTQAQTYYCYDAANRLSAIQTGVCSTTSGTLASFTYDNANRPISTLRSGSSNYYTFDPANELTQIQYNNASGSVGNITYAYDRAGRQLSKGGSLATTGLPAAISVTGYNAGNQLTAWNGAKLTYDSNGNMTSDGTNSYTWDATNKLTQIQSPVVSMVNVQAYAFTYDPSGRRLSKTVGNMLTGTTTNYLYDGENKVQESGALSASYLNGDSVDSSLVRTEAGVQSSLIKDALGSTIALQTTNGSIQTSYTYEPYGAGTQFGTTSNNDIQFTGRENDGSGLYYYRNRYYSPALKRFISADPVGLSGGANLYAYAAENPVSSIDPNGTTNLNLFPQNQPIAGSADNVPLNPFSFSVGAHGDPNSIYDPQSSPLPPSALADMIKANPLYHPGEPVDLHSCNTGKGPNPYAQQLANELGSPVSAPDNFDWYYPDGSIVPGPFYNGQDYGAGPNYGALGNINTFYPVAIPLRY